MESRIQHLIMESVAVLPETRKWYQEAAPRYTESELNQFFGKHFKGALTLKRIEEELGINQFTRLIEKQLFAMHEVKKHSGKYRQTRLRPAVDANLKTIQFIFETRYGTPELDLRSLDFDLQRTTGTGLNSSDLHDIRAFLLNHPVIVLKELTPTNSPQHTLKFYRQLAVELAHARRSGTHLDNLLEDDCSELSAEERSLLQMRQATLRDSHPRCVSFSVFSERQDRRPDPNRSMPDLEPENRKFTL